MHVVDAIATDGPSVVAEVILNSGVPHLKFRKEERRSFLSIRGGLFTQIQAIYFVQIPGLLFVTQELKQLWVKNRLRASLFKNTPYFYPRLDFRESTLASKEEQTLEMFSLVVFGRF